MTILETKSTLARRWRTETGERGPAGGLYANGQHSVADMVGRTGTGSGYCGSICTGSQTIHCC